MRTLLTFMILLLSATNFPGNRPDMTEVIEIEHTGMEDKPIKTLNISTKKVNAKIGQDEFHFTFAVTNAVTYQAIIDFVKNNQRFFTNDTNKNHGDYDDYAITVKGKVYNIFYKLKDQFFSNLILYIKAKKEDKSLIEKLSIY
jgi:hypothetical protein